MGEIYPTSVTNLSYIRKKYELGYSRSTTASSCDTKTEGIGLTTPKHVDMAHHLISPLMVVLR